MKSQFVLLGALCLAGLMASASYAGTTINGTSIIFNDATVQSTAKPADHGGTGNTVNGSDSFIGGGYNNLITDDFGTIGGGLSNQAGDDAGTTSDQHEYATVGGGFLNTASGSGSTVGGGKLNVASGGDSTVGGGYGNTASGNLSTVGGGENNTASDTYCTIGGGEDNTAIAFHATVGGGQNNEASGWDSTVCGGNDNTASGPNSTVCGGLSNTAGGWYSFAAGKSASDGGFSRVFVWDDGSGSNATISNTFNVNASNGIYFNGGPVHTVSDRNKKEAFSFVSAREILDKVLEMPLTTWRFKTEDDSVRHIGPMAQDFMAAFGYGVNDTHITATDADGVALAAIQGLYQMLEEREETLDSLNLRAREQDEVNTALRWHNAQLEARLARLENAILREDAS